MYHFLYQEKYKNIIMTGVKLSRNITIKILGSTLLFISSAIVHLAEASCQT